MWGGGRRGGGGLAGVGTALSVCTVVVSETGRLIAARCGPTVEFVAFSQGVTRGLMDGSRKSERARCVVVVVCVFVFFKLENGFRRNEA